MIDGWGPAFPGPAGLGRAFAERCGCEHIRSARGRVCGRPGPPRPLQGLASPGAAVCWPRGAEAPPDETAGGQAEEFGVRSRGAAAPHGGLEGPRDRVGADAPLPAWLQRLPAVEPTSSSSPLLFSGIRTFREAFALFLGPGSPARNPLELARLRGVEFRACQQPGCIWKWGDQLGVCRLRQLQLLRGPGRRRHLGIILQLRPRLVLGGLQGPRWGPCHAHVLLFRARAVRQF